MDKVEGHDEDCGGSRNHLSNLFSHNPQNPSSKESVDTKLQILFICPVNPLVVARIWVRLLKRIAFENVNVSKKI